jgi:hypothetical protein
MLYRERRSVCSRSLTGCDWLCELRSRADRGRLRLTLDPRRDMYLNIFPWFRPRPVRGAFPHTFQTVTGAQGEPFSPPPDVSLPSTTASVVCRCVAVPVTGRICRRTPVLQPPDAGTTLETRLLIRAPKADGPGHVAIPLAAALTRSSTFCARRPIAPQPRHLVSFRRPTRPSLLAVRLRPRSTAIRPIVTHGAPTSVETPCIVITTRPVQTAEPDHTGRGPPVVAALLPQVRRKKRYANKAGVPSSVEKTATANRLNPSLA